MNEDKITIVEEKILIILASPDFFALNRALQKQKQNGWKIESPPKFNSAKTLWEVAISQPVKQSTFTDL
ncbi:MAG: hypothetical protein PVH64_05880 [Bacillota bacterium]|jgi:hypothetical protein